MNRNLTTYPRQSPSASTRNPTTATTGPAGAAESVPVVGVAKALPGMRFATYRLSTLFWWMIIGKNSGPFSIQPHGGVFAPPGRGASDADHTELPEVQETIPRPRGLRRPQGSLPRLRRRAASAHAFGACFRARDRAEPLARGESVALGG